MNDDIITLPFVLDGEESGCFLVCEPPPTRDLNALFEDLHIAFGSGFVWTLKQITLHNEFKPLDGERDIFIVGGEKAEDYTNLLNAARKAVEYGYCVYLLPNPRGIRTADFIFVRKGVYKLFDLKTISGTASVGNRLIDSIGQTNRVLLNMTVDYNARLLASDIKTYFESNLDAVEVLIYKGKKTMSVSRYQISNPLFNKIFRRKYEK